MSINSFTEIVDASGQKRLSGNNNFLFLISATAAVTVQFSRGGTQEIFTGQIGGLQVARVKPWDYAFFIAAPGTSLTFYYGAALVREDASTLQQQIATIAGTVPVVTSPASALSTPAATVVGTAAASTIAANLLRRRITICSLSTNTGSVFIQTVGAGAGRGIELQPGQFVEIDNTVAMDVRNDSGANQTFTVFEES